MKLRIDVEKCERSVWSTVRSVPCSTDIDEALLEATALARNYSSDHCVYVYAGSGTDNRVGRVDILGGGKLKSYRQEMLPT